MLSVSDSFFALPPSPPAPAGRYPFHVRGSVYVRDLECYRTTLTADQLARVLSSLPDPSYPPFLSQAFVATHWYDLLPLLYLRTAVAKVRGVPAATVVREVMAHQLRHSQGGVTGILLKEVSASSVAAWVPRVSESHYDFGRVETSVIGPSQVRCVRFGVPRPVVRFWSMAISVFIEAALLQAGAKAPRLRYLEATSQGEDRGHEVFTVPYELTWG
ncbi:MAG TPA: hypothetical protein VGI39_36550 [Polyangiaceae bacterium]